MTGFSKYLTILFCLIISFNAFSQQKTKITLVRANDLKFDKRIGDNIERLIGDVILKQDSTLFYCDSAYLNKKDNNFDAFGNVHIDVNDSTDIYSDLLNYEGSTKIAYLHYNVIMEDNRAVLTTEHLTYHRLTGIAYYNTGGRIVSDTNVLTSIIGYYYSNDKDFFFKDSVVLTNPDYVMYSDTLKYNTDTEVAYILGPTNIIGEEDSIYCERGKYDTKNDVAYLKKNAFIQHNEQQMYGDSIYFDSGNEYGEAYDDILMRDTLQDVVITGNYAEFDRVEGYAFVTDSAVAIMIDQHDSLFLHADTLMIISDSLEHAKSIFAYYKVKFFREDLQGLCDSMVYYIPDSTVTLFNGPVIWTEDNQLFADTIRIVNANDEVDSMVLVNSCFIISMDDTLDQTYNQIKGKNMVGYFKKNRIYKITVSGNSETLYYVREEDRNLIGVNKTLSSKMLLFLEDNEIITITYIDRPDAVLYPEGQISEDELKLKGFKWRGEQRPKSKWDIFIWDEPSLKD